MTETKRTSATKMEKREEKNVDENNLCTKRRNGLWNKSSNLCFSANNTTNQHPASRNAGAKKKKPREWERTKVQQSCWDQLLCFWRAYNYESKSPRALRASTQPTSAEQMNELDWRASVCVSVCVLHLWMKLHKVVITTRKFSARMNTKNRMWVQCACEKTWNMGIAVAAATISGEKEWRIKCEGKKEDTKSTG